MTEWPRVPSGTDQDVGPLDRLEGQPKQCISTRLREVMRSFLGQPELILGNCGWSLFRYGPFLVHHSGTLHLSQAESVVSSTMRCLSRGL